MLFTRKTNIFRNFVELNFKELGINVIWEDMGENEVGKNSKNAKEIIKVDKKYYRPDEVDLLIGNSTKARN